MCDQREPAVLRARRQEFRRFVIVRSMPATRGPRLSVVVVAYDMARELPRTLHSLSTRYQRGIEPDDYEIIVVDNGSPVPLDAEMLAFSGRARTLRLDPAPPSPVRAANEGLKLAEGELIGLWIDGARLASPGLLATARLANAVAERPVITCPAWHLGDVPHKDAARAGYDQSIEDDILAGSGWEDDGYELFSVSTFSGSSGRGIFGPMGESNALFLRREMWEELGGLDERFVLPGGGLANHDVYQRACGLRDAELIVLLGEGTFHQYHGGASTSGRIAWDEMHDQFVAITGHENRPPKNRPRYIGSIPDQYLKHVKRSSEIAIARATHLRAAANDEELRSGNG